MPGKRYGRNKAKQNKAKQPAANNNNNWLRRFQKAVTDHVLDFADQTVLHGPKYFINRGTITGGEDAKTGEAVSLKMSRFDRFVC